MVCPQELPVESVVVQTLGTVTSSTFIHYVNYSAEFYDAFQLCSLVRCTWIPFAQYSAVPIKGHSSPLSAFSFGLAEIGIILISH